VRNSRELDKWKCRENSGWRENVSLSVIGTRLAAVSITELFSHDADLRREHCDDLVVYNPKFSSSILRIVRFVNFARRRMSVFRLGLNLGSNKIRFAFIFQRN